MVYLAIESLCGVETDQGNYYIQESGQARNRVDLQKETGMATKHESKMFIITNQYCPAIGSTTSDDIPFIVKGGDELPARGGAKLYLLRHRGWDGGQHSGSWTDSQIETSHGVPEVLDCHCRRVGSISRRIELMSLVMKDYLRRSCAITAGSWKLTILRLVVDQQPTEC
jgi:hypothetical protein